MAIKPPPGYVTRSKASKLYNRSQRSLERDLEVAQRKNDLEVLSAFKLIANGHDPQDAQLVTTGLVETLKQGGKNPAWCVNTIWLEMKFGRKGSPRPEPVTSEPPVAERVESHVKPIPPMPVPPDTPTANNTISADVEFLKERIRVLEKEKQQEIERNQERERELFSQLAVKDKQISSWDTLSQGLAMRLATGQLKPNPASQVPFSSNGQSMAAVVDTANETSNSSNSVSLPIEESDTKPKQTPAKRSTKKQNRKSNQTNKKTTAKKSNSTKSVKKKPSKKRTGKVVAQSKAKQLIEKPKNGLFGILFGNRNER